MKIPLSILDLGPIGADSSPARALAQSLELARHAERWGYRRIWFAEHHNMPGSATAATAVVIAHVAHGTSRIRVGAGGIILPNHSPLVVAEQFGTLDAFFPGRIELGLGRAPGTNPVTARALRRSAAAVEEEFPQDVAQVIRYLWDRDSVEPVRAFPGWGSRVPIWILGSSEAGATVAAELGRPFAFASHYAPKKLTRALELYRARFRPSEQLSAPCVMLGLNVVAADTDAQARFHASSLQQAVLNRRSGRAAPVQPPIEAYEETLAPPDRALMSEGLACSAIGSPSTVRDEIRRFVEVNRPDELIVSCEIFDHPARLRSRDPREYRERRGNGLNQPGTTGTDESRPPVHRTV